MLELLLFTLLATLICYSKLFVFNLISEAYHSNFICDLRILFSTALAVSVVSELNLLRAATSCL